MDYHCEMDNSTGRQCLSIVFLLCVYWSVCCDYVNISLYIVMPCKSTHAI